MDPSHPPRLLEDAVAELIATPGAHDVMLIGRHGSGKTTALRELGRAFGKHLDLRLLDEDDTLPRGHARVTIRAASSADPSARAIVWMLAPWSDDDCREYLRATHPESADAALRAWQQPAPVADLRQRPELCRQVLDHQAQFARIDRQHPPPDSFCSLAFVLATRLGQRRAAARSFSLRTFGAAPVRSSRGATDSMLTVGDRHLLDSLSVRALLAAEELVRIAVARERAPMPPRHWPEALVAALAHLLHADPVLMHHMTAASTRPPRHPALLLSILCAAEPAFRPPTNRFRDLAGARLCGIDLRGADLAEAKLQGADLTGARLSDADLRDANLTGARLRGADLQRALLTGCVQSGGELEGADLRGAIGGE
ncbi:MAG: pentapeptide repeat-containing protein [Planctomycetota bacterium]